MNLLKIFALGLFMGLVYLGGDLIANNAAFINTPGPLARLHVYFTLNRAWTTGGYPLPEVHSRVFYGDTAKLDANIRSAIGHFPGWRIERKDESHLLIRVAPSFWHHGSRIEVTLSPVRGGLRLDMVATSLSTFPDLGADRNDILNLFHEIGDENAIHPPV